ncbi:MAG: phage tail assembly chaperone [Magnetospirillum sp.]|nr:phage tail assembly chaperone [Magnetospirillum sp.]
MWTDTIPWRRYREIGMGIMGWPPSEFWAATPHDFQAALTGWQEARGGGSQADVTAEDVSRLRAMLDEDLEREARGG